ncbi:MAG: class I SAM-dependent methyltransferase [Magnetospirillum sp.]|nr:class I SAM-dependent methyltransferase [Magnetospirillum sp.]
MNWLSVLRKRRALLSRHFDVVRQFEVLEESCVPSYTHPNWAAAAVSWWRLAAAARLYRRWGRNGAILDFGAGTGEIHHLLTAPGTYDFVEGNPLLADALQAFIPAARQREIGSLPDASYDVVMALDSLEHNDDVPAIVAQLFKSLKPGGTMILSGPTENWLYRLGRRLAGFSGHYHTTTIAHIEQVMRPHARLREVISLPFPGLALFRVTAWVKK